MAGRQGVHGLSLFRHKDQQKLVTAVRIRNPDKKTTMKHPTIKPASEKVLHQQVCAWINIQYPKVMFTSDSSGSRVTIGLQVEFARKRCKAYKVPDLIILQPKSCYCGLIIELKKDGEVLQKKDGELKTEHLKEQARALLHLAKEGYFASFEVGFDAAIRRIKLYMELE